MSRDRLARIERIERMLDVPPPSDLPLSHHERAELLALGADRAARFPGEIDQWDAAMLEDFMAWSCADGRQAARLDDLRRRSRSQEEIAAERAMAIAIEAMSADVLAAFMDEMASPPEPKGSGSCPS